MCEGHYDILTEECPRGDTVFIPAEGPELDALVERAAWHICRRICFSDRCMNFGPEACHESHTWIDPARAAIEALRGG